MIMMIIMITIYIYIIVLYIYMCVCVTRHTGHRPNSVRKVDLFFFFGLNICRATNRRCVRVRSAGARGGPDSHLHGLQSQPMQP